MIDGFFSQRANSYERENAWILSPDFIEPLVPSVFGDGRMLDVGAGTGVICEYAQSIGWKASALDNNEDMLRAVNPDVTVFVGDAHQMPFPDNTFDLVACRQSIQYLDFEKASREMLRVSRGQVRMLHAFINREDIPVWQRLFELARGPKRRFFSHDMLSEAIDRSPHSGMETKFQKSRERFQKPLYARDAIDRFLAEHTDFCAGYRVDNQEDCFFYDLNWVVHIVNK